LRFALAFAGTRGDVEIGVAIGRELGRRGHDVRIAVSPDFVSFATSRGLNALPYGPDSQDLLSADFGANLYEDFPHIIWRPKDLSRMWHEYSEFVSDCWTELSSTLASLAEGSDIIVSGLLFEDGAANIAEHFNLPFVTLHYSPVRSSGDLPMRLPRAWRRSVMTTLELIARAVFGRFEDRQRRELGLPKAKGPATRRITKRGALEIQAYEEVCFPGLASDWSRLAEQRPFVGTITLESPTGDDEKVASWIAAGTKPICFAFGSMVIEAPADTIAMISSTSAELGQRALVCSGSSDFSSITVPDHILVVGIVNYATVFPACLAVVHHGGAGTLAACLRAGVPQLILWAAPDRQMRGAAVKRLGVGTSRRYSRASWKSLSVDLRAILTPKAVARAREIATRTIQPAESLSAAADLVEECARARYSG
jgi:UDP:flavonoid glycosyltransferase YjiC (YdhE family)